MLHKQISLQQGCLVIDLLVKNLPAYPIRKSSLILLAVFLLPLLAKELHTFFSHHAHDHHLQHCEVSGVHLHDPHYYAPENCPVCAILYTPFFNDAISPLAPSAALHEKAAGIGFTGKLFTAEITIARPRGPPAA